MTDRAQDTEAIRAALARERLWRPEHAVDAEAETDAALGRLVARLEAAEQALAYVVAQERYWLVEERARKMAEIARAALAAAAPGETTEP